MPTTRFEPDSRFVQSVCRSSVAHGSAYRFWPTASRRSPHSLRSLGGRGTRALPPPAAAGGIALVRH